MAEAAGRADVEGEAVVLQAAIQQIPRAVGGQVTQERGAAVGFVEPRGNGSGLSRPPRCRVTVVIAQRTGPG
ncbi:hypothetical protein ACH40D_20945 [Streptomyces olivaceoviridis]|uniref:Uncharacterized protein n=1 Tax=Streptomyces olivaceoviridis TaxID=1921 RepID=A0ABW7VJP4_STROI|nr:hypothetical protein [Streptomyces corchorusii]